MMESDRGIGVRNSPPAPPLLKGTATKFEGTATKIKAMDTDSGRLAGFMVKGLDTGFVDTRVQQPFPKGSMTPGLRVWSPRCQGSDTQSHGNRYQNTC
jgi:hypothetical protein